MIIKDGQNEEEPGEQSRAKASPAPEAKPGHVEKALKIRAHDTGRTVLVPPRKEAGDRSAKIVLAVLISFLVFSILLYLEGWMAVSLTVFLLALAAGIVGSIRPQWVVFWSARKTRKRAALYFAVAAVALACAVAVLFWRASLHRHPMPGPDAPGMQAPPPPSTSSLPPASSLPSTSGPESKRPFFWPTEPFEFPF